MNIEYDALQNAITHDISANSFIDNLRDSYSHWTKHDMTSNIDTLNRLLHEEVYHSSTFDNNVIIETQIERSIMANLDVIEMWLSSTNTPKLTIQHTDMNNTVGVGYEFDYTTHTLTEYKTDTYTTVLHRNTNARYGFTVTTIYPNILPNVSNRTPTGRNLTGLIQKTDTYKNASTMKRAYLLYQAIPNKNKPDVHFYTGRYNNDEALMLNIQNKPNVKTIIRIKETDLSM